MTLDLPRTSAFAALLVVLAGYLLVFRPLETAVEADYANLDAARATLELRLANARRIPALERNRSSLDTHLRRLHLGDRRAASVERFLRTVAGISIRDQVAVQNVASYAQPPPSTNTRTLQPLLVDEVPLDLTIRGRYGDVIRAIRDLNSTDAAARIALASLGSADRRFGAHPQLNAAFHVTILRAADDASPTLLRPL